MLGWLPAIGHRLVHFDCFHDVFGIGVSFVVFRSVLYTVIRDNRNSREDSYDDDDYK